jgi:hypothetical protein
MIKFDLDKSIRQLAEEHADEDHKLVLIRVPNAKVDAVRKALRDVGIRDGGPITDTPEAPCP